MDYRPPGSLGHYDTSCKNTGVGCHVLLQGIFPTQGLNPCLMSPALPGGFFTTSTIWEEEVIPNSWLSVSKPRDARPCEDTVRRGPSTSQEERPHQQPTLMATLILGFQPPEPRENNCPLSQSMILCCGDLGELIHLLSGCFSPPTRSLNLCLFYP